MSPKDFRQISHPEPKISNSLVNCTHTDRHTHRQTHARTWVNLELTTRGGSAKNSDKLEFQKVRLKSYTESINKALALGLDTVILDDTNIDTNPQVDYNLKYNSKELYNVWMDNIIQNNLVIHNTEFTRYAPHQKPSVIDHVTSNCPQHIDSIITKPTLTQHGTLSLGGEGLQSPWKWNTQSKLLPNSVPVG